MDQSRLDAVLKQIDKKYGAATVVRGNAYPPLPRFSSGIFSIDAEIGGGIPKGRIMILTGAESTGKTSVAMRTVATAQKTCRVCNSGFELCADGTLKCPHCKDGGTPMVAFYCDIEGAFDRDWFVSLDGDMEPLLLFQPEFAEQAVDVVEAVLRTGEVDLIVVDSIAMMTPAVEIEKSASDQIIGTQARLVNRMMRMLQAGMNSLGINSVVKPSVLLINQLRDKVGVMYGSPDTMPGGKGQSYASSITLKFFARPSERLFESEGDKKPVGQQIRFNVEKNKTYPAHRQGMFTLYSDDTPEYGAAKGKVDNCLSIAQYAVQLGVVTKAGSWFSIETESAGLLNVQGLSKLVDILEANWVVRDEIAAKVMHIAIEAVKGAKHG